MKRIRPLIGFLLIGSVFGVTSCVKQEPTIQENPAFAIETEDQNGPPLEKEFASYTVAFYAMRDGDAKALLDFAFGDAPDPERVEETDEYESGGKIYLIKNGLLENFHLFFEGENQGFSAFIATEGDFFGLTIGEDEPEQVFNVLGEPDIYSISDLSGMLTAIYYFEGCELNVAVDDNNQITRIAYGAKERPPYLAYEQYALTHEKEDERYHLTVTTDFNRNVTIELLNEDWELIYAFQPEAHYAPLQMQDVNLDGYTDIVVNTGGTLNETKDLYTYDPATQRFDKVIYNGFEMLSYFEVYDGYIKNWAKESASSGVVETLVWDGNTLVLESTELYTTE